MAGVGVPGRRLVADLSVGLEIAMRARAARMDHAFGNAFAIEVSDLLDERVVLGRGRAAFADRARRLCTAARWRDVYSEQTARVPDSPNLGP